jgi:protein-serine/threonine kinase
MIKTHEQETHYHIENVVTAGDPNESYKKLKRVGQG